MIKNHIVKFLVDESQLKCIKNNASERGHKTVSSYVRELAMNGSLNAERLLTEIHREVVKNGHS